MQYENTEDVSMQFYWLSAMGVTLLLTQAAAYYTQTKDGMFDSVRPCVTMINLLSFMWFVAI